MKDGIRKLGGHAHTAGVVWVGWTRVGMVQAHIAEEEWGSGGGDDPDSRPE